MADSIDALRVHLLAMLDWEEAHVGVGTAIEGLPSSARGVRPPGFEHSAWQIVEHIRLAQEDIVDFCVNAAYVQQLAWPDDYWPESAAPPSERAWEESLASYRRSLEQLKTLVRDVPDLTARVPTGKSRQTYLRAFLLVADHTAYHVGQLVAVRKALGAWKA